MTFAMLLLAAVTAERMGELWLAKRNTDALIARGGREIAAGHYGWIVMLHTAWLLGLWIFGSRQPVNPVWFGVFLLLQVLRLWVLGTLGRRWTTRIIVVPGERLVAAGPYKWVSHPNYLVVAGEIATLPLALRLPLFALIFSVANAVILAIRIRAENTALAKLRHASVS